MQSFHNNRLLHACLLHARLLHGCDVTHISSIGRLATSISLRQHANERYAECLGMNWCSKHLIIINNPTQNDLFTEIDNFIEVYNNSVIELVQCFGTSFFGRIDHLASSVIKFRPKNSVPKHCIRSITYNNKTIALGTNSFSSRSRPVKTWSLQNMHDHALLFDDERACAHFHSGKMCDIVDTMFCHCGSVTLCYTVYISGGMSPYGAPSM